MTFSSRTESIEALLVTVSETVPKGNAESTKKLPADACFCVPCWKRKWQLRADMSLVTWWLGMSGPMLLLSSLFLLEIC